MGRKAMTWLAWTLIFVGGILLAMVGSAYAAQVPQDPQLPIPGLPPIKLGGTWWAGLLMGMIAGVQAMFVGLLKKRDPQTGALPKFDLKLCAKTLTVGLVVGLVAYLIKWAPSDMAAWFVASPIGGVVTAGLEDLVDLVWKKLRPAQPIAS